MRVTIFEDKNSLAKAAAEDAARSLRAALQEKRTARIIAATGASPFEFLESLNRAEGIDWARVEMFHLDEYVGMPVTHPASFRRYLRERFVSQLPTPLKAFHEINGEGDSEAECARLDQLIGGRRIDVACVGIGENGHLAFNDPPADFETRVPYIVVNLDEACRRQQLGEGWFPTLEDVPNQAISMSIRQIMKSRCIVCTVPDRRKAEAVKAAVESPVTPNVPASILQQHTDTTLYLDRDSASLLTTLTP